MKIRALTAAGDWQFGQGLQSYNYEEAAIEQNLETSLLCFLYDCYWDLTFGVDWWNLIGGKNPAAEANILLQTREIIIASYGVVRINSVSAALVGRSLSLSYNIDTIYSPSVAGSVNLPTP